MQKRKELIATTLKSRVKVLVVNQLTKSTSCPVCFRAFDFASKIGPNDGSPTLDHVHGDKTTIKNLAVICHRCNRIKNSATADEHRRIAEWMDEHV